MAVSKVVYKENGIEKVLIDLTSDTVAADKMVSGITAHDKTGALITGTLNASLPSSISKLVGGKFTLSSALSGTTTKTITHGLGATPDLTICWYTGSSGTRQIQFMVRYTNVASTQLARNNYRYTTNGTSIYSGTNTSYGISGVTSTTFTLTPYGTNSYFGAGTYKWLSMKF